MNRAAISTDDFAAFLTALSLIPLILAVVFERDLDLGPVGLDSTILQLHVQLGDFRNPQVSQTLRGHLHGHPGSLFPRLTAGTNEFDYLVYTSCHLVLLLKGETMVIQFPIFS